MVLGQGSCDKLRTGGGVKRRRIARRFCTWKIFVLHGPSPTADTHILTKHNTNIKTSHEWQKCTDKYDPLDGNLYSISWRESPDTSTVCNNEDKRNHPHHLFSHCVSYSTYQDPRVSGNTSGNLILCCKPQICCLALRAAPHILESQSWIAPFWGKGTHQNGRLCGLRLV